MGAEPLHALVIDDAATNLRLLEVILLRAGYRVTTADTATGGIEVIRRAGPTSCCATTCCRS